MIDLSQFNAVDWIIIVVISVSVLLSLWRGFVREALSLLGWVAAFVVAHVFVDRLAIELAGVIANVTGRYIAAYALLFVSTLVVFTLVVKVASGLVRAAGLSVLDRLLGTIFGFARGVIIILVAAYVIRQLVPPEDQQWMYQSVLMPHLNMLADWVQTVFSNTVPGGGIST
ncbi:CvpA family protein [Pseudohalioglobus lutimaris]|uniref:Colicin V production protein n=1 Tax=Pseudohalioglobus lutimaris TaxID=1737061 RepID=A0A2N5X4L4_9GAMM|nr:CvpA family protein [Pseudohalioglobus lutimaris]PLW69429.1 colicin V production protein [Pseudohalioglobus lutimaris]